MENNYENMTSDADFTLDTPVSDDIMTGDAIAEAQLSEEYVADATEAVSLAEEYSSSAEEEPFVEAIEEAPADKKSKKTKKEKKEKTPKPKKEKKVKEILSEDEKAKKVLSKRKKFHFMNFSRRLAVMCIIPLIVLVIVISAISSNILTSNLEKEIEGSLKIEIGRAHV